MKLKYYQLTEECSGCPAEDDAYQAKSAGEFALGVLERMGYSVSLVDPPEDPNQTQFDI